jgi:hypothetical protein
MAETKQSRSQGIGGRIVAKLLMPLVATTVSAAATYAAKKAPELIEERVLPKLREAREGGGVALKDVPAKARSASEAAGDLASGLTDRVRAVAGAGSGDDAASASSESRLRSSTSTKDRERARRERAEHREARRKQSRS